MIFQICYLSYATDNFDKDIKDILAKSRENNQKNGITGMLVYRDEMFIQVLEGFFKAIQDLYGKIAMDLRHSNLSLVIKQEVPERVFADWSMGYKDIGKLNLSIVNDVLSIKELQNSTRKGEFVSNLKVLELMKKFRYFNEKTGEFDNEKTA
jgi:hypothetical protein